MVLGAVGDVPVCFYCGKPGHLKRTVIKCKMIFVVVVLRVMCKVVVKVVLVVMEVGMLVETC